MSRLNRNILGWILSGVAVRDLERKWTRPINNWSVIYAQLCIVFEKKVNQEILKIHSYWNSPPFSLIGS